MTLDRRILDIRLVAMLLIFLVASVALTPAWSPTQASTSAPCEGCSVATPEGFQFLEGVEREAAIAKMLNSEDYKKVEKLLVDAGYKPLIEYAAVVNTTYDLSCGCYSGPVIGVGVAFATSNGTLIASDGTIAGVAFIATLTHVYAHGFIFNTVSKEFILKVESASKEASFATSSQECTSDQECQELWGLPTCRCVKMYCEVLNTGPYNECIDDCDDDRDACLATVGLICVVVCETLGPVACAACVAAAILGCWLAWDVCRQQCLLTWCLDWYHECQC